MPRRQAADQQQVDHQVEIGNHCLAVDAERTGNFGLAQQAGLTVGEHGPELAQGFGERGAESGKLLSSNHCCSYGFPLHNCNVKSLDIVFRRVQTCLEPGASTAIRPPP